MQWRISGPVAARFSPSEVRRPSVEWSAAIDWLVFAYEANKRFAFLHTMIGNGSIGVRRTREPSR
jgi:hypothetical protein